MQGQMFHTLRKMSSAERAIVTELEEIKEILKPDKPTGWYEKVYNIVVAIGKYVGIPGVIIAAIAPSQKLITDLIEHQNKSLIESVYLDHVSKLVAEGSMDRANILISTLENQKNFDARLQYYKAKVLVSMAV